LREWKAIRELSAALEVRGFSIEKNRSFVNLEKKLRKLIGDMRSDLQSDPLTREFICSYKSSGYGNFSQTSFFVYYFDDYGNLDAQMQIMENYGAVRNVTVGQLERYRFNEDFIDYLMPI
jgi:hypothetical protein